MQSFLFLASLAAGQSSEDVMVLPFEFVGPVYAPVVTLGFGTPTQWVSCVADVGSSDTLMIDTKGYTGEYFIDRFNPTNLSRDTYGELCRVELDSTNAFDSSQSSTFSYNISDTELGESFVWNQYEDVQGLWAHDVMTVGNYSQLIVAGILQTPNTTSCVVGLGPSNGEIAGKTYEERIVYPQYENFIDVTTTQLSSPSYIYSMWFSKREEVGSIIMGGTDRLKYVGNLTLVPIVSYVSSGNQVSHIPGTVLTIRIMLHGISVFYNPKIVLWNSSTTSTITPRRTLAPTAGVSPSSVEPHFVNNNSSQYQVQWTPALEMKTSVTVDLSTLELFSRLPEEMVQQTAKLLGLTWIEELGLYSDSCHAQGMVHFNVSGMYIQVSLSDLMVPAKDVNITEWQMSDGSDLCLLTLVPESSYSYVLGTGLLRNIYTFYDLDMFSVGFAPLNNSMLASESEIIEYQYRDRYTSMNMAPAYSETSLSRDIAATFYATSVIANANASVVRNAAPPRGLNFWGFIYLLASMV